MIQFNGDAALAQITLIVPYPFPNYSICNLRLVFAPDANKNELLQNGFRGFINRNLNFDCAYAVLLAHSV